MSDEPSRAHQLARDILVELAENLYAEAKAGEDVLRMYEEIRLSEICAASQAPSGPHQLLQDALVLQNTGLDELAGSTASYVDATHKDLLLFTREVFARSGANLSLDANIPRPEQFTRPTALLPMFAYASRLSGLDASLHALPPCESDFAMALSGWSHALGTMLRQRRWRDAAGFINVISPSWLNVAAVTTIASKHSEEEPALVDWLAQLSYGGLPMVAQAACGMYLAMEVAWKNVDEVPHKVTGASCLTTFSESVAGAATGSTGTASTSRKPDVLQCLSCVEDGLNCDVQCR